MAVEYRILSGEEFPQFRAQCCSLSPKHGDYLGGLLVKNSHDKSGINYYYPSYEVSDTFCVVAYDLDRRICQTEYVETYEGEVQRVVEYIPIIGMIELQQSPYNKGEIWLKYIEIRKDEQGKGHLAPLLNLCVDFMKKNGKSLRRSTPSAKAPKWLASKFSKMLDDAGVPWSQSTAF